MYTFPDTREGCWGQVSHGGGGGNTHSEPSTLCPRLGVKDRCPRPPIPPGNEKGRAPQTSPLLLAAPQTPKPSSKIQPGHPAAPFLTGQGSSKLGSLSGCPRSPLRPGTRQVPALGRNAEHMSDVAGLTPGNVSQLQESARAPPAPPPAHHSFWQVRRWNLRAPTLTGQGFRAGQLGAAGLCPGLSVGALRGS